MKRRVSCTSINASVQRAFKTPARAALPEISNGCADKLPDRLGNSNRTHMTRTNFLRPWLTLTLIAAASFVALNARGAVGDIYESNEGNILRFKPVGGAPVTFASGLANPKGLVFDGKGKLFVADASRDSILFFNTIDGTTGTYVAVGLDSPVGLAFDVSGNLYVADAGSGNVYKFIIASGAKSTFASGVGGPGGLAFDNSGNLFVADFTGGIIYKVAPNGTKTSFATGIDCRQASPWTARVIFSSRTPGRERFSSSPRPEPKAPLQRAWAVPTASLSNHQAT